MTLNPENVNDAGFHQRLQFVTTTLQQFYGLEPHHVVPIAYDLDFAFPYNNFVYLIDFGEHDAVLRSTSGSGRVQAGTDVVPKGTRRFVMRLINPLSGLNDAVRVENEVGALQLGRAALQAGGLHSVIPRVFAWGSAREGQQGWMLQEYMPGEPLLKIFNTMPDAEQAVILARMADILACFQRYELPDTIQQYGGITFGPDGELTSSAMSIMDEGPFDTYEDLVLATIHHKLKKADQDTRVRGWRDNGVRVRLDKFLETGVPSMMKDLTERKKTLAHADFSIDNILYDPQTLQITAVFDFDFAHVATVADDFYRSLGHGIGRFPDPRDGDETLALNRAMLGEFPDPTPERTEHIDWPAAKAWDDALRERGMCRPGNIPGMTQLSTLFWLSSQILPFLLTNEVVVRGSSQEALERRRADGETQLMQFLDSIGY